MIEILLSASLLCFQGTCWPALLGRDTPVGTFTAILATAPDRPYGGDVLVFATRGDYSFAIHRAINARRRLLLDAEDTQLVTNGCVNVSDQVYEYLRANAQGATVVIR